MKTILIIVCVLLLIAIFLDFIVKQRQRRASDERAEKIKTFVDRQL